MQGVNASERQECKVFTLQRGRSVRFSCFAMQSALAQCIASFQCKVNIIQIFSSKNYLKCFNSALHYRNKLAKTIKKLLPEKKFGPFQNGHK